MQLGEKKRKRKKRKKKKERERMNDRMIGVEVELGRRLRAALVEELPTQRLDQLKLPG